MTFRPIWLAVVCAVLSNVLCYIGHPGKRGLRQVRIKERFQQKRQRLESLSLSQDPKYSLEKLRLMSKGKMHGSPLKLLEEYISANGRSLTLAFQRALQASVHHGDLRMIDVIFSKAVSCGLDQTILSDWLLEACAKTGDEALAKQYLEDLLPSQRRYNWLFNAAVRRKNCGSAVSWLGSMEEKGFNVDESHFNSILRVSVKREGPAKAERHLQGMMERGLHPDDRSFALLLDAYAKQGKVSECSRLLQNMSRCNVIPDQMHFAQALKACAKVASRQPTKAAQMAEKLVRNMRQQNMPLDPVIRKDLHLAAGEERFKRLCKSRSEERL